jgi:two-component system, OmpR family, phosphate regulon sensor histidine kinase PhoR
VKLGIRAKLFILSLALIGGSTLIVLTYARSDLEAKTVNKIEDELRIRVMLAEREVEHWISRDEPLAAWQPLVKELADASHARVSVIRRDGTVVADSSVEDVAELNKLQNHLQRPEVQAALRTGTGFSRRHSSTTEHDLLYVAGRIGSSDRTWGVLRMALEIGAVEHEVEYLQRGVGIGAGLALLLALVTASTAAVLASRATRQLTEAARRMSQGDLSTKVPQLADDEFGELGRTLSQLAQGLSATMTELRLERDRVEGILTRMREGVLLVDERQHVLLINPALREMLLLKDDSVGKSVLEVIRHGELKKLLDNARKSGEETSQEIEISGLKPRHLMVRAAPIGDAGGVLPWCST